MAGKRSSRRRKGSQTYGRYESSKVVQCDDCKEFVDARGFHQHAKAHKETKERVARMEAKRRQREDDDHVSRSPKRGRHSWQADPEPPQSPSPSTSRLDTSHALPTPQIDEEVPTQQQAELNLEHDEFE
ncbi:hypothetical protein BDY19DRAFT_995734 [Irpex rosettiformis]|uniref:Uncharacterized protein n=1 Tax=Irpex rosettiformis TaxID=378272 RepID=A0ACB8TXF3_9APHY|nr:hypothetical protein BDY19DRAFT_995734 [Irpex rosettiformis]